jgi:hypothetical protein
MILDSRVTTVTDVRIDAGEVLLRQFLANIAIEIAIGGSPRIALAGVTPNLLAGFAITRKTAGPAGV